MHLATAADLLRHLDMAAPHRTATLPLHGACAPPKARREKKGPAAPPLSR